MIEIEYVRQDDALVRSLLDRLVVRADGRASFQSFSNGRWPGSNVIGVFERQLAEAELSFLSRALAPAALQDIPDQQGKLEAGARVRVLGVRQDGTELVKVAEMDAEPPELLKVFNTLDALAAGLRDSPSRAVEIDWEMEEASGQDVRGRLRLRNPGEQAVSLRLPADKPEVQLVLEAWLEVPIEQRDQSNFVRVAVSLEGVNGAELRLDGGETQEFPFRASPRLTAGTPLARIVWMDAREPQEGGPLSGVLYSSVLPLQISPAPQGPDENPGCLALGNENVSVRGGESSALVEKKKAGDSTDDENFASCIQTNLAPPGFLLTMPVRDLTRADAIRIVVWLVQQNFVTLHGKQIRFDSSCNLLAPVPGQKITVEPAVAGATWKKIFDFPPVRRVAEPLPMDPRGIVMLWSCSKFLKEQFGAREIFHPHFTDGRVPHDCHDEGRAIDFSGVEGTFPNPFPRDPALAGRPYSVTVYTDWGLRPVPAGKGPPHPRFRLEDDKTLDFAAETDPKKSAALEKRRAAAVIFGPFYNEWVAPNCSDRSESRQAYDPTTGAPNGVYNPDVGPPPTPGADPNLPSSTVGETQGYAIGPDYKVEPQDLRGQHVNHLHFQVSKTGHEKNPP